MSSHALLSIDLQADSLFVRQTFRKEHNHSVAARAPSSASAQSTPTPNRPSNPISSFLPTPTSQTRSSFNGQVEYPTPPDISSMTAVVKEEPAAAKRVFVHPSRLSLVAAAPAPPPLSPVVKQEANVKQEDDVMQEDDDLIVVESSFKRRLPPPPSPLKTGSNAKSVATTAAVKTVEDAWASKRSSTMSQRAESESTASTSRRDSLASRGGESPIKSAAPSKATMDASAFIQQALAGPAGPPLPSKPSTPVAEPGQSPPAPPSEPPPPSRTSHALPPRPATIIPPFPDRPAAPLPTGPRALSIKGAGRSPPTLPLGPSGLAPPRGPRADMNKVGVINVVGGARKRSTSATSTPAPAQVKQLGLVVVNGSSSGGNTAHVNGQDGAGSSLKDRISPPKLNGLADAVKSPAASTEDTSTAASNGGEEVEMSVSTDGQAEKAVETAFVQAPVAESESRVGEETVMEVEA